MNSNTLPEINKTIELNLSLYGSIIKARSIGEKDWRFTGHCRSKELEREEVYRLPTNMILASK